MSQFTRMTKSAHGDPPTNPEDLRIWEAVIDRFIEHPKLDAGHIKVEVHEGFVTLKGRADTEEEKVLACQLALEYPGVKDVRNELHVDMGVVYGVTSLITQLTTPVEEKKDEPRSDKKKE